MSEKDVDGNGGSAALRVGNRARRRGARRVPGVRIITPGGQLDSDELAWVGHRAVREVLEFRADIAVLGVCAWNEPTGLTATSMHDAEVKKAILTSANRVVAVTTPDKFGTSATFIACPTDHVDALVTSGLGPDDRLWVTAAGVEVLDQDG